MSTKKTKAETGVEQIEAAMTAGTQTVEKAVKASTETMEKAVKASAETVEKAAQAGTEAVSKSYDQAVAMTKEQVQTFFPAAAKNFDEFAAFNRGALDATLQAGALAAKGFEAFGKEVMAYNRKAFADSMATAKALMGCKTLQDVIELQTETARTNFDSLVAQGTKLSELSVKLANQTVEPITMRVTEAMEKFVKPAA